MLATMLHTSAPIYPLRSPLVCCDRSSLIVVKFCLKLMCNSATVGDFLKSPSVGGGSGDWSACGCCLLSQIFAFV